MKQKIIFTVLPNGIQSQTKLPGGAPVSTVVKVSVAISLQVLDTGRNIKLNTLPDMLNWPDLINKAKFSFQVNGNLLEAKKITPPADTDLWKQMFTPEVNVNQFTVPDKTNIPILSYPVKNIADYVKFIVDATGKKYGNDLPGSSFYTENPFFTGISNYHIKPLPKRGRNKDILNDITVNNDLGKMVARLLNINKGVIPFSPKANPQTDFAQLSNFHGLYSRPRSKTGPVKIENPQFEFHDILSIITQYPQLMRKLGLVIDFEIPITVLAKTETVPSVRAFPSGINFSTATALNCPGTAYEITASGFYPKSQPGSFIDKGHVNINTDAFTVFQIDTDGAALKLVSSVDALQLKKASHINDAYKGFIEDEKAIPFYSNRLTEKREGLPTLRTAGIGIAKNGMAEHLRSRFKRVNELKEVFADTITPPSGINNSNASYVSGKDGILYADDINTGYRVDVKVLNTRAGAISKWNSLHFHKNEFSIPGTDPKQRPVTIDLGIDEGFIQLSTSEDKNLDGPHMKLSEVIARWEGWSLSVPMPGKGLNEPLLDKTPVSTDEQEAAKYNPSNNAAFKLKVVPQLVPGTLPKLRFGQTYAIKLRTVDLAGNSVPFDGEPENAGQAVISNIRYFRYEPVDSPFLVSGTPIKDGESSEVMVIRSNEGKSVKNYESSLGTKYPDVAIRHVKPPRTTVGNAITHGMLDTAIGDGKDKSVQSAVYNKINEKDPEQKSVGSYEDAKVEDGTKNISTVNYLADPMASGVSLFLSALDPLSKIPGVKKMANRFSFYSDTFEVLSNDAANERFDFNAWMGPKPFRIKLIEGDIDNMGIKANKTERVVEIFIPPGYMLKLNYASYWRPDDITAKSGILNMMGMNNLNDSIGQGIASGQHWMFSPWRTLTLVHAVQQPVSTIPDGKSGLKKVPAINRMTSVRSFGDSVAGISIDLDIHGPSTGVVDIEAEWTDIEDDGFIMNSDGYQKIMQRSKVNHFTSFFEVNTYVFGDFPKGDQKKEIINNPFKAILHQFSDTRHRVVNYKVIASTRYKEYFFTLIDKIKNGGKFDITQQSEKSASVNILSSTRPLAPQVAYVIAIYERERVVAGNNIVINVIPGLRVYLKRPWYSSGEAEKLGVIVMPSNTLVKDINKDWPESVFTTLGTDPTKGSAALPGNIFANKSVFLTKQNSETNLFTEDFLSAEGLDAANKVGVAAFDVKFDEDRNLYYADIMMEIKSSYFPFIRLALAAYQQHSVRLNGKDCCLSAIVQADYIQLPARRTTFYSRSGNTITVGVNGYIAAPINDNKQKLVFILERIETPASEEVHITLSDNPVEKLVVMLDRINIKNFEFTESKTINLPADVNSKPYRVKILEYEMIHADPAENAATGLINPVVGNIMANQGDRHMGERLVFAEVYEIKQA